MQTKRRKLVFSGGGALAAQFLQIRQASAKNQSALIAFSGEINHPTSLSDDAIIIGIKLALEDLELSQKTKSLSFELITLNDNSIPARGIANLRALAKKENLVGVFGGKFSPNVLEMSLEARNLRIPIFAPWSAADAITADPKMTPYTFRLSMRDSWAIAAIFNRAKKRNFSKLGLLIPNNGWGRSCEAAARQKIDMTPPAEKPELLIEHYQWADPTDLLPHYKTLIQRGIECLILVANESETGFLAYEIIKNKLATPPIISHWGITGGDSIRLSEGALMKLDLEFVQTFNFNRSSSTTSNLIANRAEKILKIDNIRAFPSQTGIANAYDLMMMIGLAVSNIDKISSEAVTSALKNIKQHHGLIRTYIRPFAGKTQDALSPNDLFFCRFSRNGEIIPTS